MSSIAASLFCFRLPKLFIQIKNMKIHKNCARLYSNFYFIVKTNRIKMFSGTEIKRSVWKVYLEGNYPSCLTK